MQRVLEPEVMDTLQEAIEYDAMDFIDVNTAFAEHAINLGATGLVLDAGTGTARIPILMCQRRPNLEIIGIDLAQNMLEIGKRNIEAAGLQKQIYLELVDSKRLPYQDGQFDMVISNSLVHHLPDPVPFFKEIKRVLKPDGAIFIRDLLRPVDEATVNSIVDSIGTGYNEHQTMLFRDSLHAAFTIPEVQDMLEIAGITGAKIYKSSDLHWTVERQSSIKINHDSSTRNL
ncbi:UbiE/COQ5 methyltransferase [Calothrix sp. NIES-4071]|nr:UbiE/COQ5 methyltransferase [Calothrix sp. NIES-4071]BAZ55481.1 UbiE/COQ5 methyltransferase [Calothrix sp. NIES-4105]